MASLTIRQLDDDTKTRLRLRAAQNGRSMEDEARTILRQAAAGPEMKAPAGKRNRKVGAARASTRKLTTSRKVSQRPAAAACC